jgi:hypothetical protein
MTLKIQIQFVPVPPLTTEQKDAVVTLLTQINSWEDFRIFAHCDSPDCDCETWCYWDEKCDYGDASSLIDLVKTGLNTEYSNARMSRGQILTAIDEFFGYTPKTARHDYDYEGTDEIIHECASAPDFIKVPQVQASGDDLLGEVGL